MLGVNGLQSIRSDSISSTALANSSGFRSTLDWSGRTSAMTKVEATIQKSPRFSCSMKMTDYINALTFIGTVCQNSYEKARVPVLERFTHPRLSVSQESQPYLTPQLD